MELLLIALVDHNIFGPKTQQKIVDGYLLSR